MSLTKRKNGTGGAKRKTLVDNRPPEKRKGDKKARNRKGGKTSPSERGKQRRRGKDEPERRTGTGRIRDCGQIKGKKKTKPARTGPIPASVEKKVLIGLPSQAKRRKRSKGVRQTAKIQRYAMGGKFEANDGCTSVREKEKKELTSSPRVFHQKRQ